MWPQTGVSVFPDGVDARIVPRRPGARRLDLRTASNRFAPGSASRAYALLSGPGCLLRRVVGRRRPFAGKSRLIDPFGREAATRGLPTWSPRARYFPRRWISRVRRLPAPRRAPALVRARAPAAWDSLCRSRRRADRLEQPLTSRSSSSPIPGAIPARDPGKSASSVRSWPLRRRRLAVAAALAAGFGSSNVLGLPSSPYRTSIATAVPRGSARPSSRSHQGRDIARGCIVPRAGGYAERLRRETCWRARGCRPLRPIVRLACPVTGPATRPSSCRYSTQVRLRSLRSHPSRPLQAQVGQLAMHLGLPRAGSTSRLGGSLRRQRTRPISAFRYATSTPAGRMVTTSGAGKSCR